jgi:imidazolonepropionase-like amidohydrolase
MDFPVKILLLTTLLFADIALGSSIVIRGVTTIEPKLEQVREQQTVVVANGRIIVAGDSEHVATPSGARVIDAQGKFMIPGLADMHVHLEHFETPGVLDWFLVNGVTLIRQMDGRARILDWRDSVSRGQLDGPEIITAGPVIDGDSPAEPDYAVARDFASGVQAVRTQASAGYDLIKIYHGLSEPAFKGVMSTAMQLELPVAGHVPWRVGIQDAVLGGLKCIEHMDGLDDLVAAEIDNMPEPWHWRRRIFAFALDPESVEAAAKWFAANDVWNVPTLTVKDLRWLDSEDRGRRESNPSVRLLPRSIMERWQPENWSGDRARQYKNLTEDDFRWIRAGYQNALQIVGALQQSGAPIMLGTDTPNPWVVPGESVHLELSNMVSAGLSPMQALATATSHPATYLSRPDIGCLRAGCQADLVLLRENPMDDIAASRSIHGVMVDGEWINVKMLEQGLANRAGSQIKTAN